jgi:hypothetical protein
MRNFHHGARSRRKVSPPPRLRTNSTPTAVTIPKMTFKVVNWPAYEAGLRRRGSLILWIEDAALEHW